MIQTKRSHLFRLFEKETNTGNEDFDQDFDDNKDDGKTPPPTNTTSNTKEEMDWRSFRANLVAKERGEASPSTGSRTWAYNAGNVIESGSLIVASTRSAIGTIGFGLRQQYFHKCVMLILDHTKDFTKGLIINRFREGEGPHFGGDVSREKVVLHTSKDEDLRRLSVNVVGDLYMSTVDNVKLAVGEEGWGGEGSEIGILVSLPTHHLTPPASLSHTLLSQTEA